MFSFQFYLSGTSLYFIVVLLLNSSRIAVFAEENAVQRRHKCIPKSAASTIKCVGWATDANSYCGSTRNEHVFSASDNSPMAATANNVLDETGFQVLRDVIGTIDSVATDARRTRDSLFRKRNCTNFWDRRDQWLRGPQSRDGSHEGKYVSKDQEQWVRAAIIDAHRSNISTPTSNCFELVTYPVDSQSSEQIFAKIDRFMSIMRKFAKSLHEHTREGNTFFDKVVRCWPKLYNSNDGRASKYPFNCRVTTVAGIRRNGAFHLPIGLTNVGQNDSVATYMRLIVVEHWTLNSTGKITADIEPAFRRGDNTSAIKNTTTTLRAWGGPSAPSHFLGIPDTELPAMKHVLKKSEAIARNVLDSITASNTAILVLPAALAFIPVSVIEYLSRSSLCITILFTDIIPVLPLAIKGIELLISGRKPHTGCAANTVGTENSADELAVVELWCAKCDMDPTIFYYGVAFFSIAVLLMVLGIFLELSVPALPE